MGRQSAGGQRVDRIFGMLRRRGVFCSRRCPTREVVFGAQPPEDWRRTFGVANLAGSTQVDKHRAFYAISFRKLPNYSASKFPAGATAGIQGLNENGYVGGNRIWKKITRSGSVVEHRVYIHAGPNLIAESNAGVAASTPVQEYVYGGEIDSLVMIRRSDATKYGVTRNRQWSITALHDLANGNLIDCIVNLPAKLFLKTQIPAALCGSSTEPAKTATREKVRSCSLTLAIWGT